MAEYKGASSESQRVVQLQKRRERHAEEMELKRKRIAEDLKLDRMEAKFASHIDAAPVAPSPLLSQSAGVDGGQNRTKQECISATDSTASVVGLLTVAQMKDRQSEAALARDRLVAQNRQLVDSVHSVSMNQFPVVANEGGSIVDEDKVSIQEVRQQQVKKLTFTFEDDDDFDSDNSTDDNPLVKSDKEASYNGKAVHSNKDKTRNDHVSEEVKVKKRFGKNPDVDTSFLPDTEREAAEEALREQLRQEWQDRQRRLKAEPIDVVFSYWDGSGHRRSITLKKGDTIHHFLQKCLEVLRSGGGEFHELRSVTADQLMYVKEDLIIPHTYTFYDFIVTKARGKSGPLFSFDVHDDVRMVSDANVEKDESHAGKVVLRSWYERNKHIFPASRWEPYDPAKKYSNYSISDKQS